MKIGKVSESVLKRSVLRQLKTKSEQVMTGAGVGEDCAIFAISENDNFVTCVQEGIIQPRKTHDRTEAEENMTIGRLIQKCANNLAAGGAVPIAVSIALVLPEAIEEPDIKALMAEADEQCGRLQLQIVGGQTRVSRGVTVPIAVATGYGTVPKGKAHTAKDARPGQDIVVSKWIGLEGTAILAKRNREALLARYPAYLVEAAEHFDQFYSIIPEAATAGKSGSCAMHDASEGGIFTAIWELAEGAGVGLTIDLKKLPIRQETVEVCECCNVNPYELASGGCLVMTSENGAALVATLAAEGIPAAVVGRLTDSNDRIVINDEEVRYMDRPRTDEIYKL